MRRRLGIIGSFEMDGASLLEHAQLELITTPFGKVEVTWGLLSGVEVVQMTRSGSKHPLPPHEVNYRANIAALQQLGVTDVVGTSMIGSLRTSIPVGSLVLLDQFLDFTRGRPFTYYAQDDFAFVDVTDPYCRRLRKKLLIIAAQSQISVISNVCYVCVEGPRFETRAEVRMYANLGGDVIGQTNVPECTMAREAGLCYAAIGGVVNLGAGLSDSLLVAESFESARARHMTHMLALIRGLAASFANQSESEELCSCGDTYRHQRQRRVKR